MVFPDLQIQLPKILGEISERDWTPGKYFRRGFFLFFLSLGYQLQHELFTYKDVSFFYFALFPPCLLIGQTKVIRYLNFNISPPRSQRNIVQRCSRLISATIAIAPNWQNGLFSNLSPSICFISTDCCTDLSNLATADSWKRRHCSFFSLASLVPTICAVLLAVLSRYIYI